jgi:outer membrane receptor protein involved in Fe transport
MPIPGARVRAPASGREIASDERGRFEIDRPGPPPVELAVSAAGYSERTVTVTGREAIRVVLTPLAFADEVTVTASRAPERVRDTPASVVAISSSDLELAAPTAVDAVLRQVPGFTLFRRADSRTANPTTQGASLRGVGGSGASRALVLDDGVPLNDPFGGWISWGRIVESGVDRVEVVRGGSSDRYGAPAMSGVIQVVPRDPVGTALAAEASYGSASTGDAQAFAAASRGPWSARVSAEGFRTDGFVIVAPEERGIVDVPADSRHTAADASVEYGEEPARLFLRGGYYDEDRGNGTPLQVNDTRLWQLVAGADGNVGRDQTYSARVYGLEESYHQTFSAVSADRSSETLTRVQDVPSRGAGLTAQWEAVFGDHRVLAGLDGRYVTGESDELGGASGATMASAGGRQETAGILLQDRISAGARLSVTLALRYDDWRNLDAFSQSGPTGSPPPPHSLPSRSADAWSPRAALIYQVSQVVSVTGSAYRAFRAPTLNELYRNFRVGNTLTLANPELGPETLVGGEAGGLVSAANGRFFARLTGFWAELQDTIVNRTLASTPNLITRERDNVGRSRSRGAELDLEARLTPVLAATAGWMYADARALGSGTDATLAGKQIAQVPRHQASLELRATEGPLRVNVVGRYSAAQWEDDLNTLRLPGFTTLDAQAAYAIGAAVEVFLAGENLTDRRVVTGKTPQTNIGPPRWFRGGVRVRLGE